MSIPPHHAMPAQTYSVDGEGDTGETCGTMNLHRNGGLVTLNYPLRYFTGPIMNYGIERAMGFDYGSWCMMQMYRRCPYPPWVVNAIPIWANGGRNHGW